MTEKVAITSGTISDSIPPHVAIIMDGNGRWATKQGLPRIIGHRAGVENCRLIIRTLSQYGVKYLTLYAFSTENWKRPALEINGLFQLMGEFIVHDTPVLHKELVKIITIGDLNKLPHELQDRLQWAMNLTQNNNGMSLVIALNYGGRAEILNAVQKIIRDNLTLENITEELFNRYLYTGDIPYPDLIIRTGGEVRISNFLLWQGAYSEYYFTSTLWPDFNKKEVDKAFRIFRQRIRRFGGLLR